MKKKDVAKLRLYVRDRAFGWRSAFSAAVKRL